VAGEWSEPSIVGTFLCGERLVGSGEFADWIYSIRLDGVELDLADVLADLTIRVGRDDVTGSPQPSSLALALHPVDRAFTRLFSCGTSIEVRAFGPDADPWALFTGVVSDAELDDDLLAIAAAGVLANANRVELDISGWVAETWSARAARLLGSTRFGYVVEPDPSFDPILEPPVNLDTGLMLFATYASSLADAVGAAIVDTPDGRLVAQAIGSRSTRPHSVHALDPAKVAFAPKWLQTLDVVNVIEVQYGPDDAVVSTIVSDQASIDRFDRRSTSIEATRIQDAGAAHQRGMVALSRNAFPAWGMRDALHLGPIPGLAVGDRVVLSGLPASAPTPEWTPIVEGWTHTITGPTWELELALSDPSASGLALQWQELAPSGSTWAATPPLEWNEADELGDFQP